MPDTLLFWLVVGTLFGTIFLTAYLKYRLKKSEALFLAALHNTNEQWVARIEKLSLLARDGLDKTEDTLRQELNQQRERLYHAQIQNQHLQNDAMAQLKESILQSFTKLREDSQSRFSVMQENLNTKQVLALTQLQDLIRQGMNDLRQLVGEALLRHGTELGQRMDRLGHTLDERLLTISGQVEQRLDKGFEKTSETFVSILSRLAIIDEAQKRITELSSNVVSLQEILSDKRSRGAFGEIQLNSLIKNVMPEQHYEFQKTLSNGTRADCVLLLPEPTGNIVIDAKFPLERFLTFTDLSVADPERKVARAQFRQDIRKHIQDIASKYIIAGETGDGAIMFIPAEAVFAEIHAHFPDVVEEAQRLHVWMASPTTMMAILTTTQAVLKDAATRQQVHVIQAHLRQLAQEFSRFEKRMDNLARHIDAAHTDVEQVHTTAKKISHKFTKIEQVNLAVAHQEDEILLLEEAGVSEEPLV